MAGPEMLKLMRNLRAVREYTAEPVSQQALEAILEVGRWTGTGSNRQPTDVVVIRDPAVKARMGEWGARPAASAAVVLLLATKEDAGTLDEGRYAERMALAARACRPRLLPGHPQERGSGRDQAPAGHP